jgi:hypothetical protein
MTQVHSQSPFDFTAIAGTTSVATSTAEYHACYWSAANTVALINTTTNYSKFAGIIQSGGYASANSGSVRLRAFGNSKAVFSGANTVTAAGDYVSFDVATTTAHGRLRVQARTVADATAGVAFIVGQSLEVSGATATVGEIFINPQFSSAITTTVAS